MAAYVALGVGGVLSLGLEVVYVHLLSIVAGNSTYAFGLMVATFLIGLSIGGEGARRLLLRSGTAAPLALVCALLGLAASVALGAAGWNGIPDYFGSFAQYPAVRSFGGREAVRGMVCALVMVPPTLFIGAGYVLAMDLVTSGAGRDKPMSLGMGAGINTLGNIAGVLLFGFVLLPLLGGLQAGRAIAWAAFALALLIAFLAMPGQRRRGLLPAGAALAALLATSGIRLDYSSIGSGANVYFQPQRWGQIVDHAESIDGGLTSVARQQTPDGRVVKTLLTNGKFQGNDAEMGEMQAQIGFALAPLLHQDRRERALVIGYGTGVTSRVLHEAGFRRLDIAELSRDIVRLADEHFGTSNARVSAAPGVAMHITDGRNFLLLSPDRYDLLSLEITSIWFAGAASLYNQDFYQLARARMQPDGVLQQWVQLHRLSPTDILQIVASIRAEFRYVSIYLMGSQGVMVATNAAQRADPVPRAIESLANAPGLAEARRIADQPITAFAGKRLVGPDGVDRFLREAGVEPSLWISTDDNLRLEYDTPKANVNDSKTTFSANVTMLERYR